MKLSKIAQSSSLEDKSFLLLLLVVSLAFFWVLWPFYGSVFWGAVFAIMFNAPFVRLLQAMPQKRTIAAVLTVSIILVLVILPIGLISALLTQEAASVYQRVQSGDLSFGRYFQQIYDALPEWITGMLNRSGLSDLGLVQARIAQSLTQGSQFIATQALSIGQNAFDFLVSFFIMLYLLFFFLRDGAALSRRIKDAIPLEDDIKRNLFSKFTTVIRATVKGNIAVAMLQGGAGRSDLLVSGHSRTCALGHADGVPVAFARSRGGVGLGSRGDLFPGHRRCLAGRFADRLWRLGDWPGRQYLASGAGW